MGNFISLLQEIFMIKEDNSVKIGLSEFKQPQTPPVERKKSKLKSIVTPKELKISDLMRRESC